MHSSLEYMEIPPHLELSREMELPFALSTRLTLSAIGGPCQSDAGSTGVHGNHLPIAFVCTCPDGMVSNLPDSVCHTTDKPRCFPLFALVSTWPALYAFPPAARGIPPDGKIRDARRRREQAQQAWGYSSARGAWAESVSCIVEAVGKCLLSKVFEKNENMGRRQMMMRQSRKSGDEMDDGASIQGRFG